MNHQSPPAAHPPVWDYRPSIPIIGSNGMGIFGFYLGLLMLVPGYGLAMMIMGGLETLQGGAPSHEASLSGASLVILILGSAVFIAMFFAWVASEPQVQAFRFDENQQLLTLIVTRRGRKPYEVRVPFADISYIRPTVVSSSDRDGHFRVVGQGPKGKVFEYRLGEGTSLKEMDFHAVWLQGIFGTRMGELLNLDK
jgi:hypothetical protein